MPKQKEEGDVQASPSFSYGGPKQKVVYPPIPPVPITSVEYNIQQVM